MYLNTLRVEGLRGAETYEAIGLGRVVSLPRGPRGLAVADAITLFAASLDARRAPEAAAQVGLAGRAEEIDVIEASGLTVQISWPRAAEARALLAPSADRTFTVFAELQPDPPFFGQLRELAARDPRLVTALGQSPTVCLKVGWLFANDHGTASVGLLEARVGEFSFPLTGSERPPWLGRLLAEIGARFLRPRWDEPFQAVLDRLVRAALAPDPVARARYARAAEMLGLPPFSLGHLELVRDGDRVQACFGPDLVRARQFGPAGEEAVRLACAVCVEAPDVLVVEAPGVAQVEPDRVVSWLASAVEGDDATLEQVIVAAGGAAPRGATA